MILSNLELADLDPWKEQMMTELVSVEPSSTFILTPRAPVAPQ